MFGYQSEEKEEECYGCKREFDADKNRCEDCRQYTVCSHYRCHYCCYCKEYKKNHK